MPFSNELPAKCRECAKLRGLNIHGKCGICCMLEFEQTVLCDLNRCVQDEPDFECHAFQPILKLAGSSENKSSGFDNNTPRDKKKRSFLKLLHSDKIKYERALALQKLSSNPDSVILNLKYHFVWNVSFRRSVFSPANDFIDFVSDNFLKCSELAGGFVCLLYLAPDHVHLYVESEGDISVEEIVHRIKQFSRNAILEKFSFLREQLGENTGIWDEAYFAETVG